MIDTKSTCYVYISATSYIVLKYKTLPAVVKKTDIQTLRKKDFTHRARSAKH